MPSLVEPEPKQEPQKKQEPTAEKTTVKPKKARLPVKAVSCVASYDKENDLFAVDISLSNQGLSLLKDVALTSAKHRDKSVSYSDGVNTLGRYLVLRMVAEYVSLSGTLGVFFDKKTFNKKKKRVYFTNFRRAEEFIVRDVKDLFTRISEARAYMKKTFKATIELKDEGGRGV